MAARADFDGDERKHKFNSINTGAYDVSAEDVEAYKMTKSRAEDPMANFKDSDSEGDADSDASRSSSSSGSSGGGKKGSKKRKGAAKDKRAKRKSSDKRRRRHSDSD